MSPLQHTTLFNPLLQRPGIVHPSAPPTSPWTWSGLTARCSPGCLVPVRRPPALFLWWSGRRSARKSGTSASRQRRPPLPRCAATACSARATTASASAASTSMAAAVTWSSPRLFTWVRTCVRKVKGQGFFLGISRSVSCAERKEKNKKEKTERKKKNRTIIHHQNKST